MSQFETKPEGLASLLQCSEYPRLRKLPPTRFFLDSLLREFDKGGKGMSLAAKAPGPRGRWSAEPEMAVVLELLGREDLELLTRSHGWTVATISQ